MPVHVDILPFTADDLWYIGYIQPEGWPDIMPHFQHYVRYDFCRPFKMVHDGNMIGSGCLIPHGRTIWLAHIIVHADYRGHGLGTRMTRELMQHAKQMDCDTLSLIATDMGFPVYKKLGFTAETEYVFFREQELNAANTDDPCIQPYHDGLASTLQQLDKKVSGEDRFFHLRFFLDDAWVYLRNNELCGYYIPRMGEGLIIAADEEAGLAFARRRLQQHPIACYPADNKVMTDFFLQHNYQPFRTARRMWYGRKPVNQLGTVYQRIGGNLG